MKNKNINNIKIKSKIKKINNIIELVKNENKPNKKDILEIKNFIEKINNILKKEKINAECITGGSIAKDTFLKDDFDIDLFIQFEKSYENKDISKIFENVLIKNNIKYEKIHGSRDYFIINYQIKHKKNGKKEQNIKKINKKSKNLKFEIVPVLKFKKLEEIKNITDMSPLHVSWVKNRIKENQKQEIRITKKFLKAINVYGAESYIKGFSGHVTDILVLYYGSFLNLLKASQKWKKPVIIDIEKHYKTKQDILFNLNKSKLQSPLIVIDPILKTRNAAAGLSDEKFELFIKKAKEFLLNPSIDFFKEKKFKEILKEKIKKKCENKINKKSNKKKTIIVIELKNKINTKKDITGCKVLKLIEIMSNKLKNYNINLIDKYISFEITQKSYQEIIKKINVIIEIENKMPKEIEIIGPPVSMEKNCHIFKEKYKNKSESRLYEKNNRLYAKIKIKKNIKEIIIETFENSHFKKYFDINYIKKY